MKILHAIRSMDPKNGGPQVWVRDICKATREWAAESEILCTDRPDSPWLTQAGARVHAAGPAALRYGYCRSMVPWLRKHLNQFDIVLTHGVWPYPSFAVWSACRATAVPYAVYTHGVMNPWFKRKYPLKHIKKWLYWHVTARRILRDAAAVLFACEEERRLAKQCFPVDNANELVLGMGISQPPAESHDQREAVFRAFPETRGKRLLLFLGRIHEVKGCDILLAAFGKFLRARESAEMGADPTHLLICGPCEDSRLLKRLKRQCDREVPRGFVTWAGMLSGDLKWGALRAADAFVLPSHCENFGMAAVEALACGLPVLLTNKVNIWREIAGDSAGLVADDDIAGVSNLLKDWSSLCPERRRQMRTNAGECFVRRFDVGTAAQLLKGALMPLIGPSENTLPKVRFGGVSGQANPKGRDRNTRAKI